MKLNELYIAPEAEVISFRAAERLAASFEELEGGYISFRDGVQLPDSEDEL